MKRLLRAFWPCAALGALLLLAAPVQADDGEVKALYAKHCKICHAKDGSGQTKQGKKTDTVDWRDGKIWEKVDDETSKKIILEGKGKMKGYASKIPADKVDALLAFSKAFSKPAEAEAPAQAEPPAEASAAKTK